MTTTDPNARLLSVLPWVRSLSARYARAAGVDPADAAQDAAAHLLERGHLYDPARGQPTTWAAAVLRQFFARPRRRAEARLPTLPDGSAVGLADPRQPEPGESLADAEGWLIQRRRLYSAMRGLTELVRKVIRLRFGFGGGEPVRRVARLDPTKTANANGENLRRALAKLEAFLRRPPKTARRLKKLRRAKERAAAATDTDRPIRS